MFSKPFQLHLILLLMLCPSLFHFFIPSQMSNATEQFESTEPSDGNVPGGNALLAALKRVIMSAAPAVSQFGTELTFGPSTVPLSGPAQEPQPNHFLPAIPRPSDASDQFTAPNGRRKSLQSHFRPATTVPQPFILSYRILHFPHPQRSFTV